MNIVREFNDRVDVVADWLGFGDDEPRHVIRVTRRPVDDRNESERYHDDIQTLMIVAIVMLGVIILVAQTRLWQLNHEPAGTYYVERTSSSVSGFGDR